MSSAVGAAWSPKASYLPRAVFSLFPSAVLPILICLSLYGDQVEIRLVSVRVKRDCIWKPEKSSSKMGFNFHGKYSQSTHLTLLFKIYSMAVLSSRSCYMFPFRHLEIAWKIRTQHKKTLNRAGLPLCIRNARK